MPHMKCWPAEEKRALQTVLAVRAARRSRPPAQEQHRGATAGGTDDGGGIKSSIRSPHMPHFGTIHRLRAGLCVQPKPRHFVQTALRRRGFLRQFKALRACVALFDPEYARLYYGLKAIRGFTCKDFVSLRCAVAMRCVLTRGYFRRPNSQPSGIDQPRQPPQPPPSGPRRLGGCTTDKPAATLPQQQRLPTTGIGRRPIPARDKSTVRRTRKTASKKMTCTGTSNRSIDRARWPSALQEPDSEEYHGNIPGAVAGASARP